MLFWKGLYLKPYAFETLCLHRVEFATFVTNQRARKFLENLGATLEGVRRETRFQDGNYVDDVLYSLLETEWPKAKTYLEAKLKVQVKKQ